MDPGYFILELDDLELLARDNLIGDKGKTHYQAILKDRALVEDGLSGLSLEGNTLPYFELCLFLF